MILFRFASCAFFCGFLSAVILTVDQPEALGIGFRNPSQDTFAVARGEAFVATADNPSAVYYNPAGIVQLEGTQVSAGSYLINMRTRYRNPRTGERTKNEEDFHLIPHLYFTHDHEGTPFHYGFGLTVPFGLANEWPDDEPFGRGELTYISFMPTVAVRLSPTFSIGGGLTVNHGEADLVRLFPGGSFRFKGDDLSVGYHLGALWQPTPKHSYGINFRSHDRLSLEGSQDIQPMPGKESAKGAFPIPEFLVIGYSYRPTPDWNIEANVDWTRWSRLKTVAVDADIFPSEIPFNWKSSYMYQIGVTRYLPRNYHVSGGYIFSENSVPDGDFTALVPDEDRHLVTVGVGRRTDSLCWDLALQYGWSPTRRVPDDAFPFDGEYKTRVVALSATIGYAF